MSRVSTTLEERRRSLARTLERRAIEATDPALRRILMRAALCNAPARRTELLSASPEHQGAPSEGGLTAPLLPDGRPSPKGALFVAPPGTVLYRRPLGDDLLVLRFARPPALRFAPGQHLHVSLGGLSRPYSIVSAPHEPFVEIFVERAPGGRFTPRLFALQEGDAVALAPAARGRLLLDTTRSVHLMVATVTGIAPFVSMLRDAVHQHTKDMRFHVIHGASYPSELGYAEELSAMPPDRVTYVPTVSQPNALERAGWRGQTGRAEALIDRSVTELGLMPRTTAVYACGHPGMIANVTATLGSRGYRVHTERYWKTP